MESLKKARTVLGNSQFPVILTGAGISAESGVPTFRGEEGLWKNHRPEDLATMQAFRRDPELVWQWYNWRKALVIEKEPNAAHHAITDFQKIHDQTPVITQNVDGLHLDAQNKNVVEMHGNLFRAKCTQCDNKIELRSVESDSPECSCGQALRPDIVWFGESLDPKISETILDHLRRCDVLIVVGTSGIVYPAAGFASQVHQSGGKIIEVNPQPVINFATQLATSATVALPQLLQK